MLHTYCTCTRYHALLEPDTCFLRFLTFDLPYPPLIPTALSSKGCIGWPHMFPSFDSCECRVVQSMLIFPILGVRRVSPDSVTSSSSQLQHSISACGPAAKPVLFPSPAYGPVRPQPVNQVNTGADTLHRSTVGDTLASTACLVGNAGNAQHARAMNRERSEMSACPRAPRPLLAAHQSSFGSFRPLPRVREARLGGPWSAPHASPVSGSRR